MFDEQTLEDMREMAASLAPSMVGCDGAARYAAAWNAVLEIARQDTEALLDARDRRREPGRGR